MGLEIALKGCRLPHYGANLSLGAADTALRMTVDFALSRRIYNSSVWDIPARAAHSRMCLSIS
jgi:hypothetical protein